MMPAELEALARRAVACKHWRWMPGMRYRVGSVLGRLTDNQCKGKLPLVPDALPDLSDPATVGCLLALVREAHDNRELVTAKYHELRGWTVCTHSFEYEILPLFNPDEESGIFCDSEAAALVEALEVAP